MNPERENTIREYHKKDIEKIFDVIFDHNSSLKDIDIKLDTLIIHIDEGLNDIIIENLSDAIKYFTDESNQLFKQTKDLSLNAIANIGEIRQKVLEGKVINLKTEFTNCKDKFNLLTSTYENIQFFIGKSEDIDFLIDCIRENTKKHCALDLLKKYRLYPKNEEKEKKVNEFLDSLYRDKMRKRATMELTDFYLVKFPESLKYHGKEENLGNQSEEKLEKIISYNLSTKAKTKLDVKIFESNAENSNTHMLKVTQYLWGQGYTEDRITESFKNLNFVNVKNFVFYDLKLPSSLDIDGNEKQLLGSSKEEIEEALSTFLSEKLDKDLLFEIVEDKFSEESIFSLKVIQLSREFQCLDENDLRNVFKEFNFPDQSQISFTDIKIPKVINYKGKDYETINASEKDIEAYLSYALSKKLGYKLFISIIENEGIEAYEYSIMATSYEKFNPNYDSLLEAFESIDFQLDGYEDRIEDTVVYE